MSRDAEQNVLGALLLAPELYERIAWLPEEAFGIELHRTVYRTIRGMIDAGAAVDVLTVGEACKADRKYIGELALATLAPANILQHAKVVEKHHRIREIRSAALRLMEADGEPDALIEAAEQTLFGLRTNRANDELTLESALTKAVEHIDRMYAMEGPKLAGVSTGLIDLDAQTGGFEAGDLIVIGARPSMGKTSLGWGFAEAVSREGKAVPFFSMEMSAKQIALRAISSAAGISMHELRTGRIREDDWERISEAVTKTQALPIHIDDRPAVTLGHIRMRCRRIARKTPIGLIVVDYLTLMNSLGDTRDERVGALAKGLKEIAKDFACPVIALAQLSRKCEERNDKRPIMADLRESGEIEQAADVILFVYRDEVYDKETHLKGIAELIIAKQRNGPIGTVYATFRGQTMTFNNFAGPMPEAPKTTTVRASGQVRTVDFKSRGAGE